MKLKQQVFTTIEPWASAYRLFKWLAVFQFLVCVVLPVAWLAMESVIWLASFTLFAFWLANYALLRMAHHHEPNRKGLSGWVARMWENLLFVAWLATFVAVIVLVVKLALFQWT